MAGETTTVYRSLPATPTLATIERLIQDRNYRDAHRLFFAEGVRNFVAALNNHWSIDTLVYSERLLTSPLVRKQVRRLKRQGTPFARLTPEEFRSISQLERASGVGLILRQNLLGLKEVTPGDYPCWVVLSRVRSPGNFGTLLRSAVAVGSAGVILLGNRIDPYHPTVVRASMGALFRQTVVRAEPEQLRRWVREYNLFVVGASPDGRVEYDRVKYSRPTLIVLGEERKGLTREERSLCQQLVRIPMAGGTDSLNLGVAGSLLMYQVMRGG